MDLTQKKIELDLHDDILHQILPRIRNPSCCTISPGSILVATGPQATANLSSSSTLMPMYGMGEVLDGVDISVPPWKFCTNY
jgi:hypothetical protein